MKGLAPAHEYTGMVEPPGGGDSAISRCHTFKAAAAAAAAEKGGFMAAASGCDEDAASCSRRVRLTWLPVRERENGHGRSNTEAPPPPPAKGDAQLTLEERGVSGISKPTPPVK